MIILLPPEVLAHAFELGARAEWEEEDDEIAERFGGTVSSRGVLKYGVAPLTVPQGFPLPELD